MALPQLKLLINLARIDGDVAEREKKYITNIGLANGIPLEDVTPLFLQDHDIVIRRGAARQKADAMKAIEEMGRIRKRNKLRGVTIKELINEGRKY